MEDKLKSLFCLKINVELDEFREKLINNDPQEVFDNAYLIDCMITLKEVLLEKVSVLKPKEIKIMIRMPNLLQMFYDEWLEYEDSRMSDWDDFVNQSIKRLENVDKVA